MALFLTLFFGKFRFRFKGGAHLLAEVQVSDVYEQRMAALWPDVRDILRAERSKVGTIRLQKGKSDELRIKLSNPTEIGTGINLLKALAKPVSSVGGIGKLDLDFVSKMTKL